MLVRLAVSQSIHIDDQTISNLTCNNVKIIRPSTISSTLYIINNSFLPMGSESLIHVTEVEVKDSSNLKLHYNLTDFLFCPQAVFFFVSVYTTQKLQISP